MTGSVITPAVMGMLDPSLPKLARDIVRLASVGEIVAMNARMSWRMGGSQRSPVELLFGDHAMITSYPCFARRRKLFS